MSKALKGSHYCQAHQGNGNHYGEHYCELCEARRAVEMYQKDRERIMKEPKLTKRGEDLAPNATYRTYVNAGWTDAQLIAADIIEPESPSVAELHERLDLARKQRDEALEINASQEDDIKNLKGFLRDRDRELSRAHEKYESLERTVTQQMDNLMNTKSGREFALDKQINQLHQKAAAVEAQHRDHINRLNGYLAEKDAELEKLRSPSDYKDREMYFTEQQRTGAVVTQRSTGTTVSCCTESDYSDNVAKCMAMFGEKS